MKKDESRVYVVPLRKGFLKVPGWRKTKRAMDELKKFILHHTKADRAVISNWVNEAIWGHGGKNPPGKIKVKVVLKEEEIEKKGAKKVTIKAAHVELETLPSKAKRIQEKETKKKSLRQKIKEKFAKKKEEAPEETKEENKEQKEQSKMSQADELKMNQ